MTSEKVCRMLLETKEEAVNLISCFEKMIDNSNEKRERELLENLKKALVNYKIKKAICENNGFSVQISIEPQEIKVKTTDPLLEVLLTKQDLKMLESMKVSIEDLKSE